MKSIATALSTPSHQYQERVRPRASGHLGVGRVSHAVRSCRALLLPLLILGCLSRAGVASAQPGTWTSNGPEGGDVVALAIDPLTPTTLYAGTDGGGVFVRQ
jgi:hypothetical protein